MIRLTTLLLLFVSPTAWGQTTVQATDNFIVTGQIRKELKITLSDIAKYPSRTIGDVVSRVTPANHVGLQSN